MNTRYILLAEINTATNDRLYTILDAGHIGPNLALSLGGLQVDFDTDSSSINRMVRGVQGVSSGKAFFETAFFSAPGTQAIDNSVAVGIANSSASLSNYVGQNSDSYGYRDGAIYHSGSAGSTIPSAALKDIIGVGFDGTAHTMSVWLNNSLISTTSSIAAGAWYPAVTVSGTTAYAMSGFTNYGQRAFFYPQAGYENGWSTARSNIGLIRISSEDYLTATTDTPATTTYAGHILNAESIQISRLSKVWPWADRNSSVNFSTIDLDNYTAAYDQFITTDIRDSYVILKLVAVGAALSTAVTVGYGIVDKVEAVGELTIRLTLRDNLTLLDRPLQRKIFPPFVTENAANKPWPILLGAARTVTPVLYDATNIFYQMHDTALTEVATVYDNADPLDPSSDPQDWLPNPGLTGIQLNVFPVNGKLTADASSSGTTILPPGPDDILGGDGAFTTWAGSPAVPNGWTFNGIAGGDNIFDSSSRCGIQSNSGLVFTGGGSLGANIQSTTQLLLAGHSYRWSFDLALFEGFIGTFGGTPGMGLAYSLSPYAGMITPIVVNIPGHYSGVVTIPAGLDRYLYMYCLQGQSGTTTTAVVDNIVFYEITSYVPPALVGITLEQYATQVLEVRGQQDSSAWSHTDAAAIDTATGPYIFGMYADGQTPINIAPAMRLPLDSYCAAMFTDSSGQIRIKRLIDPSTASDGSILMELSASNIKAATDGSAMIQIQVDTAPGLSTSMGCRYNWTIFTDAEFVTDYLEVPAVRRAQLKRRSQFVQVSNTQLANQYRHAINADPLDSLLDDQVQAQTEIDRVCGFYTTLRYFRTFTVLFEGPAIELKFGDIVRATYPRWGLGSGVKLFVVGTVLRPFANEIDIITWG